MDEKPAAAQPKSRRRFQFTLAQLLVAIAAVSVLMSQWPPYVRDSNSEIDFNGRFIAAAGCEAVLWIIFLLTRWADDLRRQCNAPLSGSGNRETV